MARSRVRWGLLVFLLWPVIEVVGLMVMSDVLGRTLTWIWILTSAALGVLVVLAARRRWRTVTTELRGTANPSGTPPDEAALASLLEPGRLSDPALSGLAGVLLIVPGPVSDVVGVALLIPGVRALFAANVATRLTRRFPDAAQGLRSFRLRTGGPTVPGDSGPSEDPPGPTPPTALPPSA